jgi:hypothetical protein
MPSVGTVFWPYGVAADKSSENRLIVCRSKVYIIVRWHHGSAPAGRAQMRNPIRSHLIHFNEVTSF